MMKFGSDMTRLFIEFLMFGFSLNFIFQIQWKRKINLKFISTVSKLYSRISAKLPPSPSTEKEESDIKEEVKDNLEVQISKSDELREKRHSDEKLFQIRKAFFSELWDVSFGIHLYNQEKSVLSDTLGGVSIKIGSKSDAMPKIIHVAGF